MSQIKKPWDLLTDAERRTAVDTIISFFRNERNEEIGILAAENVLDMFLEEVGIKLYNTGVENTKDFVASKLDGLGTDIEVAMKK